MKFRFTHIKLLICIGITTLNSNSSYSQDLTQTVRGKITDAHSSQPIVGATIILIGSDPLKGAVSDIDGYFRVEDVPVGRHSFQFSFISYEEVVLPEILVGTGKEVVLDVPMEESLTTLDEIVIVASDQDKGDPLNEMASISAISFSVEETGRFAATFDDPARAALTFAGVRGAGDDLLNEIVVRGNSPRGLLWRIEGIEVPNPNHFGDVGSSAGGISMLSNNLLTRSDFYTSAFPAEYGNALSGVFDIHLRNGNNEKREYALEAGLIGLQAAAEGPLTSDSKGSYLANFRYSTLGVLDQLGILGFSQETTTFSDAAFKINLPTGKAGTFSLWGLGGVSAQTILADQAEEDYFNEAFSVDMGVLGLKHVKFIGTDTYLQSSLTYSDHKHEWNFDSLEVQTFEIEDFRNKALQFSSLVNKKFDAKNTARLGFIIGDLRYNYLSQYWDEELSEMITDVSEEGNMGRVQGFIQWQHRLSPTFTLNSGFHYLRLGLEGQDSFEPRFGARWSVGNNQFLSAGIGLHSRIETPVLYLAQREDEFGNLYQPNRDLDLTKAIHYVFGYERKFGPDLRLKAEIYYQDLRDVIVMKREFVEEPWQDSFAAINSTSGYTSLPLSNDGDAYNYGLELTLERFFTNSYYFLITTSLFQSKYSGVDQVTHNTRFNGNYIANFIGGKEFKVGRNKNNLVGINGKIIYSGNNRITPIDLEQSITEGYTVYEWENRYDDRLNDYYRLDIGVSYRKNKPNHASIITLNIQNVTNHLNEGGRYFSDFSNSIQSWEQLGILPNLSYRIEF